MNTNDLNKWLTLLANFGVIVGIVFLVYEIRQNNEFMAAEARSTRLAISTESMTILAEDPDLAGFLVRANDGDELAPDETLRLNMYIRRTFAGQAWSYRELPAESYPIETWRRILSEPYRRELWNELKHEYEPGYVQFVKENLLTY